MEVKGIEIGLIILVIVNTLSNRTTPQPPSPRLILLSFHVLLIVVAYEHTSRATKNRRKNRPIMENNECRQEEQPEALRNEKYINKQYNFIKFKCLFQARAIIRHEGPRCKPHETDTPKAHAPAIKTAKPYRPPHI